MQRFLTPLTKRCLTGAVAAVSVGAGAAAGVNALHAHRAAVAAHNNEKAKLSIVARVTQPIMKIEAFGKAEVGKASWYGSEFGGKKTASGEHFDPSHFTCAHRTLPLGSLLRVTNLHTRKSVVVRVNDRGPLLEDRILDLSHAAAQQIGLNGLAKVRIERVHKVPAAAPVQQHQTIARNNPEENFRFLQHR